MSDLSPLHFVRKYLSRLRHRLSQRQYKKVCKELARLEEQDRQLKIMFQKIQGAQEALIELNKEIDE